MRLVRFTEMLVVIGTLFLVLAASLACASASPTSTPAAPATAAPPAVSSSATATPAANNPTPVSAQPIPTRVLPTATPVSTGQITTGGTLRYASNFNIDTLDAALNTDPTVQPILFALYNQIVQLGPSGVIEPDLAKSWDISQEGKLCYIR